METCYLSWIQRNKIFEPLACLLNTSFQIHVFFIWSESLLNSTLSWPMYLDNLKEKKRQQTSVFQVSYFFYD